MKNDKELQRDVLEELQWEPSVDAAAIGVTVSDGIVTLTGHAPSYTEKVTAEEVAQHVQGPERSSTTSRSGSRHRRAHRCRHLQGGRRHPEVEDSGAG